MAKTDYSVNKDGKYTGVGLVTKFFGPTLQEMKELSMKDRNELASAIARQEGITSTECAFELVEY